MTVAIEQILPHREPFLLIDEVIELRPGEGAVARKTVQEDEWYLRGHFPGRPVMPGVLIVEALAQTGAVAVLSAEDNRGKLALFAGGETHQTNVRRRCQLEFGQRCIVVALNLMGDHHGIVANPVHREPWKRSSPRAVRPDRPPVKGGRA